VFAILAATDLLLAAGPQPRDEAVAGPFSILATPDLREIAGPEPRDEAVGPAFSIETP
jgi:hypothetical protein